MLKGIQSPFDEESLGLEGPASTHLIKLRFALCDPTALLSPPFLAMTKVFSEEKQKNERGRQGKRRAITMLTNRPIIEQLRTAFAGPIVRPAALVVRTQALEWSARSRPRVDRL